MNYVYTYHYSDNHCRETSVSLKYELAKEIIEGGGHVKVWDAETDYANVCVEVLTTIDKVESRITADERRHWFVEDGSKLTEVDIKKILEKVKDNILSNTDKLADNNVKTAAAAGKLTVSAVPPVALLHLGAAMKDGERKYGRFNWRETSVTSSVFYDAMLRHLIAWYSGEDYAPDSGVHHLGHIMASCAILLDGSFEGVLNDDRNPGVAVTTEALKELKVIINE